MLTLPAAASHPPPPASAGTCIHCSMQSAFVDCLLSAWRSEVHTQSRSPGQERAHRAPGSSLRSAVMGTRPLCFLKAGVGSSALLRRLGLEGPPLCPVTLVGGDGRWGEKSQLPPALGQGRAENHESETTEHTGVWRTAASCQFFDTSPMCQARGGYAQDSHITFLHLAPRFLISVTSGSLCATVQCLLSRVSFSHQRLVPRMCEDSL